MSSRISISATGPDLTSWRNEPLLSGFVVSNTNDSGPGSLRQEILDANAQSGANTITFDPTAFATAQTITLTSGQLELSNTSGTETITGPAAGVTVSGGGNSRVFQVDGGVTASISGLTITGGSVTGQHGGGVYNRGGNLTLNNVTISGNNDGNGGGGGLGVSSGTTTLTNCTVSGNTSVGKGGGLGVYSGTTSLTNCTLSGNSAAGSLGYGGGLWAKGTTTVTDCTVTGNSAAETGGGLQVGNGGTMTLGNTIVAGNHAPNGPDAYQVTGVFVSAGNNLIGDTNGSGGWARLRPDRHQNAMPLRSPAGTPGQLRRPRTEPWPCCPAARVLTRATTPSSPPASPRTSADSTASWAARSISAPSSPVGLPSPSNVGKRPGQPVCSPPHWS